MFSNNNNINDTFEDSYTLDNYIQLISNQTKDKKKERKINQKINQKLELIGKYRQRKNSTQLSIFSWLIKDKKHQQSLMISLDKELILKIFSYLRLTQVVRVSQTCSYMLSCYKSLWIDRNFFEQFQTEKFTSQQLNKVIQKSKLSHIKQLKQIYMGKNIKNNRQKIKMKITSNYGGQNVSSSGSMLQIFSISPKAKSGVVFLMDSHLNQIITTSYRSLKAIQLHRCPYIKDISVVSKCLQLEKFLISFNEYVTTDSFIPISKRCLKLESLEISSCKNLDQNIFNVVKKITDLESFGLKGFRQSFANLHLLEQCYKLEKLDLEESLINDDELINGLKQLKNLKGLSIQGCHLLTNLTLQNLNSFIFDSKRQSKIQEINMQRLGLDSNRMIELYEKLQKKREQKKIV